jgi:hypothetical protein
MSRTLIDINTDDLIREYNSGKSVKRLAKDFHISRCTIIDRLNKAGIKQRNRSEAMYLRMSQTTNEERKRLTSSANQAKRGKPNTPQMLHKRAIAQKRFIGKYEQEFIDKLISAGIPVIPQEPFLSYNLDIGCGDIAVEIHTQCANPLTANFIKKLMKCVKSGKSMIYVWISPRNDIVTSGCYDKVISLIKSFRSDPPVKSKYWVIRGTGELYATGSFDSE